MGVNRSGYYKWRQRQGKMNRYERDRVELTRLLQAAHEKHPSHGYHRLAHDVFLKTGWVFSHNLAHKCCKAAGIRSKARKGRYKRPGEESILFPNQVRGHWNAAAPLQLVVSDMTTLKVGTTYWEWTILLDTFNNEILAHSVTSQISLPRATEKADGQKRRADVPGSLPHRPGSCLLFKGFLPGPSRL